MVKILICEDNINDTKHLENLLISFLSKNHINYIIHTLKDFDIGTNYFFDYDLIFLDIELKGYNGIEIASKIREHNQDSIIIITSNYQKYLIYGYKIDAKRYLLKPIDQNIFNIEMQSVFSYSFKQQYGFYDKKISPLKIHYKDILYVEFYDRHTVLHFLSGTKKSTTYPLKYWIEKLSDKGFSQPYKSFLVNLDYVSGFTSDGRDIILSNNETIPISKNFKKIFMEKYFANLHTIL